MAVTKNSTGNVIKFTEANDVYDPGNTKMMIQGILIDHSTTAAATIIEAAGTPIAEIRNTASQLTNSVVFPEGLIVSDIKVSAISAGVLYVYVVPC